MDFDDMAERPAQTYHRPRVVARDPILGKDVLLITWGSKCNGCIISDTVNVPDDYLYWMLDNDLFPDDIVEELQRRERDPWDRDKGPEGWDC